MDIQPSCGQRYGWFVGTIDKASETNFLSALPSSQSISDEILLTIMTEVESIINSRPLIPVSFEPNSQEPLTPNHLLLLRANSNLPSILLDMNDIDARRRWVQAQYLTNLFWLRFKREYFENI